MNGVNDFPDFKSSSWSLPNMPYSNSQAFSTGSTSSGGSYMSDFSNVGSGFIGEYPQGTQAANSFLDDILDNEMSFPTAEGPGGFREPLSLNQISPGASEFGSVNSFSSFGSYGNSSSFISDGDFQGSNEAVGTGGFIPQAPSGMAKLSDESLGAETGNLPTSADETLSTLSEFPISEAAEATEDITSSIAPEAEAAEAEAPGLGVIAIGQLLGNALNSFLGSGSMTSIQSSAASLAPMAHGFGQSDVLQASTKGAESAQSFENSLGSFTSLLGGPLGAILSQTIPLSSLNQATTTGNIANYSQQGVTNTGTSTQETLGQDTSQSASVPNAPSLSVPSG